MKILLHLGFPKTMSSTLQFGLFKPLEKKGLVNLRTWRKNDPNEDLGARPSSRLFNYQKIPEKYLDFKEGTLNILSDESFTAPLKLRRNNYGINIKDPFLFPNDLKMQICSYYGEDVEIIPLIIIRNQVDLIFSQYVEEYNLKKYKNIDLLFNGKKEINIEGFEIYNFSKYIATLESVFEKKNINIFLFEDFIYNFDKCCERLAKIMKLESSLVKSLLSSSHVNKKKKTDKGYFTKDGKTLIPFLSDRQKKEIRMFYREDNNKLMHQSNINSEYIKKNYL